MTASEPMIASEPLIVSERLPAHYAASIESPDAAAVLTKAFVRAIERLELSQAEAARMLGLSRPTVSRMGSGGYVLAPDRGKEWELAALLVRLYRSLAAIVGTDDLARAWLRGANQELSAVPLDLLMSAQGLVQVVQYLDAYRGRV